MATVFGFSVRLSRTVTRDVCQESRIKRSQVLASEESSWPLTNYLIKLHSNTSRGLCGAALLRGVKRTEWTQNSSVVTWVNWPQLVAAGRVGGGGGNQSFVNILDAITSCWTLPNTFMEALGKVFLYQPHPPTLRPLGQRHVIFTCRSCGEGIGERARGRSHTSHFWLDSGQSVFRWRYCVDVTLRFVLLLIRRVDATRRPSLWRNLRWRVIFIVITGSKSVYEISFSYFDLTNIEMML